MAGAGVISERGGSEITLKELGDKNRPGRHRAVKTAFVFPVFLFLLIASALNAQEMARPSWRVYKAQYNRVWNALVRVVVQDRGYAVRAADPKEGYLATWPKTEYKKDEKRKIRISINANVKKAPDGVLVTASCSIQEFVPIEGTKKGRWMTLPSDNSCEAGILDDLEKKLSGKK